MFQIQKTESKTYTLGNYYYFEIIYLICETDILWKTWSSWKLKVQYLKTFIRQDTSKKKGFIIQKCRMSEKYVNLRT